MKFLLPLALLSLISLQFSCGRHEDNNGLEKQQQEEEDDNLKNTAGRTYRDRD